RRFALRVLQSGPTAFVVPGKDEVSSVDFSPTGQWLSLGGYQLHLSAREGGEPATLPIDFATTGWLGVGANFGRSGDVLLGGKIRDLRAWSVPEGRELRRWKLRTAGWTRVTGDDFFVFTTVAGRVL